MLVNAQRWQWYWTGDDRPAATVVVLRLALIKAVLSFLALRYAREHIGREEHIRHEREHFHVGQPGESVKQGCAVLEDERGGRCCSLYACTTHMTCVTDTIAHYNEHQSK